MKAAPFEAFFLDSDEPDAGHRYCVHHPASQARGAVVLVHALGDEMNKSRRMYRLQAAALSTAGFAVLRMDLSGCGDSSGEFRDATWDGWLADVRLARRWMARAYPARQILLWGHRVGSLLADAVARTDGRTGLLHWQATASGLQALVQFLRMRTMAQLGQDTARISTDDLRAQLAAGEVVDVAGYDVPPALAEGLSRAALSAPDGNTPMEWLEVSPRDPPEALPASLALLKRWGCDPAAHLHVVKGSPFWQTTEIEDAPELIPATVDAAVRLADALTSP